jgi:transposase
MKLRKVYRFRMRPTKTQEAGLYRRAGARRFVYNRALSRRKCHYAEHGEGISARELSSELMALKGQPETLWRQVEYKAAWSYKRSVRIGRFFPSTKLCSECGMVNPNVTLSDRSWLCACGTQHDRDLNASRNILAEGTRPVAAGQTETENTRGEPVSLPTESTTR